MTQPRHISFPGLALGLLTLFACERQPLSATLSEFPSPCGASPLCRVTLAPATVTLGIGDTVRFVATSAPQATAAGGWRWTSSDSSRVRVDDNGLARAVATPVPGLAICAALIADLGLKGCATVVVTAH